MQDDFKCILRKINNVRRSITEIEKSVVDCKEKFNKINRCEKKQLEKLSANIFMELTETMKVLIDARLIAYDLAELILDE